MEKGVQTPHITNYAQEITSGSWEFYPTWALAICVGEDFLSVHKLAGSDGEEESRSI